MQKPRSAPGLARFVAISPTAHAVLVVVLEAGCAALDWRFSRDWPVSHLYYLPIALSGAVFGFTAAMPVALVSTAIFVSVDFGYRKRDHVLSARDTCADRHRARRS